MNLTPIPAVALARELPPGTPASHVRDASWTRVRPGAYVASPSGTKVTRGRTLALARIAAVHRQLRQPFVFSHESAALVWGLPLLSVPDRTHLVQAGRPGSSCAKDLVRHVHALADGHTTTHRGLPVTTLERTLVDCAMSLPARAGLVVVDAGLHVGANLATCAQILEDLSPRRGSRIARAVLDHADDGAESPGESLLRYVLLRAGLPPPETQVNVPTRLGEYWGDVGWREWKVLAEYDGRAKYGGRGSEPLVAEKRRQDAIEDEGWRVLRVVAEDLNDPAGLVRRVARGAPAGAFGRLRPRRMLGA